MIGLAWINKALALKKLGRTAEADATYAECKDFEGASPGLSSVCNL